MKYFQTQSEFVSTLTTVARKYCIPPRYNCFDDDGGLIVNCGSEYNCSDCCGDAFKRYMLFTETDIIQVQTKIFDFYNDDITNPLAGFGEWIECVVVDLSDNSESDVSNYLGANGSFVGWNGKRSYQIVELDGSLLPDCFKLKYTVYNSDSPQTEVQELCTQHYKKVECEGTILIQGIRDGYDCTGNYYNDAIASFGDTPFKWNNQVRIEATIRDSVPEKTTIQRRGRNITRSTKYIQRVNLYGVPMYLIKYLENHILAAPNVLIDGKLYTAESGVSETIDDTCIYNFSFNLINVCNETEC